MKNQPKVASRRAEIFSSIHLAQSRVYFKLRSNSRIQKSRLVVSPEEGLVVESPRKLDIQKAHRLITKRQDWVIDALQHIKLKQKKASEIKKHINSILVFGQEKIISIKVNQTRNYVLETNHAIYLGFMKKRVRKIEVELKLEEWLKEKAKRYLPLRVKQLNRGRFKIAQVFIKDQKTIWGSCSSEGNINLNWRLIMAPRFASDYIIYHELCHTRYLNHSPRYWKIVEQVCPRYQKAEDWFQEYGFLLHINLFNWF